MTGDPTDDPPDDKTVDTVVTRALSEPQAREACLVVIYGPELGKKYPIDQPELVVGRSSKANVQVDEESVSRNHAKIIDTGLSILLRDLGSTNGTFVNDEMIDEYVLKDGDQVKVGHTIFKFLSGANIENAYHEEIYRLTTIDGLTQIFNKRYFNEALEREISRAHRYHRELSLILFDIDFFKKINDSHGHLAGDHVLRQIAQVLCGRIRREDVMARYGGEEFAIILPEIGQGGALAFAEKVRKIIEQTPLRFEETALTITVSIGVASLHPTLSAGELVKLADEKLYQAKSSGRNRVCG